MKESVQPFHSSEDATTDAQLAIDRRLSGDRRRSNLKGFFYGVMKGRRRGPRRAENTLGYYTDYYDFKLLVLALCLLLLSCLDAAMTVKFLGLGAVEINPFMQRLLSEGAGYFVGVKVAVTALCVIVLIAHNKFTIFKWVRIDIILMFALFIYLGLVTYELYIFSLFQ